MEGKSDPASHTASTRELNRVPLPVTVVPASTHLSTLEPYTEASGPRNLACASCPDNSKS